MGLLDGFHAENNNYIQAIAALTMLAEHTQDSIENAGAYLLNHEFEQQCATYQKSSTQKMHLTDDGFGGTWRRTWSTLDNASKGAYDIPAFMSKEENNYYWHKDDFFGFPAIRAINLPEGKKWLNGNNQTTDPTLKQITYTAPSPKPDPLLTSLDLFDTTEAACLITQNDPIEIERCQNDTNFSQNYAEFVRASNLINAAIRAGTIDTYNSGITRESLQHFLHDKGFIIEGFNDKLPGPDNNIGNHTIGHADATHYQRECDRYQQQAEQLQAENEALKQCIAELEAVIASELESDQKHLHPALDSSRRNHAPELIQAIAAWEAKYLNNERPHMQHTPAIKAILKGQGVTNNRLITRIAAITNPNKNRD